MKYLITYLFICIAIGSFAQDNTEYLKKKYRPAADSVLLTHLGKEFCDKYIKFKYCTINKSQAIYRNNEKHYFYSYDFCINKKLCDDINVVYDKHGKISFWSSSFGSYLKENKDKTFLTNKEIAAITKKKLKPKDGKFKVLLAMNGSNWGIKNQHKFYNKLVIKIHEPNVSERMGSHSVIMTWGKYIIIDAITGKVLDKGRSRKEDIGF